MEQNHSTQQPARAQELKTFLVSTADEIRGMVTCCPSASSYCCIEQATGLEAIIALGCKRWGCKYCGPRKCFNLALKCENAAPNKFITLTVKNDLYENPLAAFKATSKKVARLSKAIRLHVGSFDYLRVLEATTAGWPHYHLIARCDFIKQDWLSDQWRALTGAPIVDIRAVKKQEGVFRYVMKYLCKQKYIPWTDRRISWSKDFFVKIQQPERTNRPYGSGGIKARHPTDLMLDHYADRQVVQRGPSIWVIEGTEGPPIRVPSPLPLEEKKRWRRKHHHKS